jgi:SAM-dependent methyltransferase
MGAATWEEIDWYELPRFYDMIFDLYTRKEADFLEAAHERYAATRGRRALEPACGSGRLVHEMARRGWRVEGSDLSESMLDYGRERLSRSGLRARMTRGDMAAIPDPGARRRFDLAYSLVSTFKYLASEAQARAHLRGVARALKPGGIFVLGFHLTDYTETGTSRERWVAERGGTRVVCNIHGWPPDRRSRRERVRSRLTVEEGGRSRRAETNWSFRTYDARQARSLLRSVPQLELAATHDFDYELKRPRELGGERLDTLMVLRRR